MIRWVLGKCPVAQADGQCTQPYHCPISCICQRDHVGIPTSVCSMLSIFALHIWCSTVKLKIIMPLGKNNSLSFILLLSEPSSISQVPLVLNEHRDLSFLSVSVHVVPVSLPLLLIYLFHCEVFAIGHIVKSLLYGSLLCQSSSLLLYRKVHSHLEEHLD